MPKNKKTFEEFYRKLKQDKIKPLIDKEKRMFETRARKFEEKRVGMMNSRS